MENIEKYNYIKPGHEDEKDKIQEITESASKFSIEQKLIHRLDAIQEQIVAIDEYIDSETPQADENFFQGLIYNKENLYQILKGVEIELNEFLEKNKEKIHTDPQYAKKFENYENAIAELQLSIHRFEEPTNAISSKLQEDFEIKKTLLLEEYAKLDEIVINLKNSLSAFSLN